MASTNDITITIRTNSTIKKRANELFSDLGLDMSSAVNLFLRQAVREDKIPFEISRQVIPSRRTRRAVKNAVTGKNLVGPFDTVEEAMKYLNA